MTPQEKAKELVEYYAETIKPILFGVILERDWKTAKQCALIAVYEILESQPSRRYWDTYDDETPSASIYWQEVKQEIEKL